MNRRGVSGVTASGLRSVAGADARHGTGSQPDPLHARVKGAPHGASLHRRPARTRLLLWTLAALALGLAPVHAAALGRAGLEHVEVREVGDAVEVRVYLERLMRIVAHAPEKRGSEVIIQLAPVAPGSDDDGPNHDSIAGQSAPLAEVVYDRNDTEGAATMTLRFTHPVEFKVTSSDPRVVVVTLLREASAAVAVQPTSPTPATEPAATAAVEYTIVLDSFEQAIDVSGIAKLPQFEGRTLYEKPVRNVDHVSHELRLGFFSSRAEAETVANSLRAHYPKTRVERALPGEHGRAVLSVPGIPPINVGELDRLMSEADAAMQDGDNARAIRLYTKVLDYPDYERRATAQELLGVARERNGQLAHAKAEYEEYLRSYPNGEAAERVRQRLAAIVTMQKPPEEKLRAPKQRSTARWDGYGTLSQFYRRDETFTEEGGYTDLSALYSDVALTGRRRSDAYDLRGQATVGYVADFVDSSDSELRVSELYLDGLDIHHGLSARAGRQPRSTGGVLGRFDGGLLGWQLLPWLRINAAGGAPVEFDDRDKVETDHQLYGLSADMSALDNRLSFNVFGIEQVVEGITDRGAVGGEARYLDRHMAAFGLLDYDVSYQELNIALLLGTWTFDSGASINASVDRRLSPILTTTNALIGQPFGSIADLQQIYSDDEIRDLARDRTAASWSASMGGALPLNAKYQVTGDVTLVNMSDTEASGGVEETPGTGNDLYYSTQLIGSGLFGSGDVSVLGLRYSDAGPADDVGMRLSTRLPVSSALRITPRLQLDYRWYDDGTQILVRPSARVEYRLRHRLQLELETGAEWLNKEVLDDTDQPWGYFFNIGYRWDF